MILRPVYKHCSVSTCNVFFFIEFAASGTVYPLVSEVNMDFVSYFRPFQNVTLPGALDLPILGPLLSNAEDRKRLAHLQATDPCTFS